MSSEEVNKSQPQCCDLISKLNCIVLDQERVAKQLEQMGKQLTEMKRFDEAIERTLRSVHSNQIAVEERFEQLHQVMNKVENEQNKVMLMQNDFRIELTNKAYMQNEMLKELAVLTRFVASNQMHSTVIRQRLNETDRELAVIGFSQNRFADSIDEFKAAIAGTMDDLRSAIESVRTRKAMRPDNHPPPAN